MPTLKKDTDDIVAVTSKRIPVSSVKELDKSSDFPQSYTEYMALGSEKRADLQGVTDKKTVSEIFNMVQQNFDMAGYNVSVDEKYDEAMNIERYIDEKKCRRNRF